MSVFKCVSVSMSVCVSLCVCKVFRARETKDGVIHKVSVFYESLNFV